MKSNKIVSLLGLMSLITLASCQTNNSSTTSSSLSSSTTSSQDGSSSSSSSSSTSVEPIEVTYENYRRDGHLNASIDFLSANAYTLSVPADYAFAYGSDQSLGKDLELSLHLDEVYDKGTEEEPSIYSTSKNFKAISFVYGLPSLLGALGSLIPGGLDLSFFPNDFEAAYPAYQALGEADEDTAFPVESLNVHLVDGKGLVYTDVVAEEGKEKLRAYVETDVSETVDTIWNLDLGALVEDIDLSSIDLTEIFQMLDMLFPTEDTIRPISSILGEIFYIVGDGLDVDINSDLVNQSVDVDFRLNETGLSKVTDLLVEAAGDMGSMLSVSSLSLGFTLFTDGEMVNQFGGLRLDAGIGVSLMPGFTMPIGVRLDLGFDKERTTLEKDYFEKRNQAIEAHSTTDAAFEDFYGKVRPYVRGTTSEIDLRSETEALLQGYAAEYANLSDDVKFMLGEKVSAETILSTYQKGREALSKVIETWTAQEEKSFATVGQITSLVKNISGYGYWKEALVQDETGAQIVAAIDERMTSELNATKQNVETILANLESGEATQETILSDIALYNSALDFVEIDDSNSNRKYVTEEQLLEMDEILASLDGYLDKAFVPVLDGLVQSYQDKQDFEVLNQDFLASDSFRMKLSSSARTTFDSALVAAFQADATALENVSFALDGEVLEMRDKLFLAVKESSDKATFDPIAKEIKTVLANVDKLSTLFQIEDKTSELDQTLTQAQNYFSTL